VNGTGLPGEILAESVRLSCPVPVETGPLHSSQATLFEYVPASDPDITQERAGDGALVAKKMAAATMAPEAVRLTRRV